MTPGECNLLLNIKVTILMCLINKAAEEYIDKIVVLCLRGSLLSLLRQHGYTTFVDDMFSLGNNKISNSFFLIVYSD